MEIQLTHEEKQFLLSIARDTIESHLLSNKIHLIENNYTALDQVAGVFVTLTINKQLKGCIGNIIGQYPIYIGVQKMAIQSAFFDPRFNPLTKEELTNLHIEISVLSPMSPINYKNVVVGKHGLLVSYKYSSGVLLPQVPVEQKWNQTQYLEGVCNKAGLPSNCYMQKDCELKAFTALVFSEEH